SEHLLALQIIARTLADQGHQVSISHCPAIYKRCIAKADLSVDAHPAMVEKICIFCIQTRFRLMDPALGAFSLADVISADLLNRVQATIDSLSDAQIANFSI